MNLKLIEIKVLFLAFTFIIPLIIGFPVYYYCLATMCLLVSNCKYVSHTLVTYLLLVEWVFLKIKQLQLQ